MDSCHSPVTVGNTTIHTVIARRAKPDVAISYSSVVSYNQPTNLATTNRVKEKGLPQGKPFSKLL